MNVVCLSGYLGDNPKPLGGDKGPVVMRISVGRRKKDKDTGEYKNFYESHDLKVWGDKRDLTAGLTEGQRILVTGRLEKESFEKNGEKVYKTTVVVDELAVIPAQPEKSDDTDNFF